jgi:hypothetical protein
MWVIMSFFKIREREKQKFISSFGIDGIEGNGKL